MLIKNESKEKQENIEREGKRDLLKYFSKIYGMQVEKGKHEHTLCMKCYNELGKVIGQSIEEEEERVYKIKEIVEAVTYAKEKGLYMAIYLPKKEGDEIRSIVRDSKEGSIWCKRFNTEEIESLICDILYDSEMNEISI